MGTYYNKHKLESHADVVSDAIIELLEVKGVVLVRYDGSVVFRTWVCIKFADIKTLIVGPTKQALAKSQHITSHYEHIIYSHHV